MKKSNIVLIGMPASGKSTMGKALAKALGLNFIDTDKLIIKREGMPLCEIIEKFGSDEFLRIENEVNASINVTDTVISPGGSVIFCEEAMNKFKENGIIVYLKIPYELLKMRLKDPVARGVILKENQTIKDIFHIRKPYYLKYADITLNINTISLNKLVKKLLKRLEEYNNQDF